MNEKQLGLVAGWWLLFVFYVAGVCGILGLSLGLIFLSVQQAIGCSGVCFCLMTLYLVKFRNKEITECIVGIVKRDDEAK